MKNLIRTFENPKNGYRENLSDTPAVWITFFGFFYLLYKGLWAHVLIWLMVVTLPALSRPALLMFTFPIVTIIYICNIKRILAAQYLKRGWIEINKDADAGGTIPTITVINPEPSPQALSTSLKKCPFCAEDVQAAAILCKHCRSELPKAS